MSKQKKILENARRRRAKLLAKIQRTGWTQTKLADKERISRSRMSRILAKAREESYALGSRETEKDLL